MKHFILICLLLISTSVLGRETFDEKVQRAKALEDTPAGAAYQDQMWPLVEPFMEKLIEKCVQDDATADLTSFIWVGTLVATGKAIDVEVQPLTNVSACFLHGMEHAPFPGPPKNFEATGLPLTFNMRLHPMK